MSEQVSFDSLLRMAVRETYMEQANSIPADNELDEIIRPSAEYEKKMRTMVRRENRNEKLIYFRKVTAKVAVVAMLCISLTFGSLMTAQAVRESVATTILEWHDKFTRIFIKTDAAPTQLPEIRFNYIPEEFELVEEESFKRDDYMFLTYNKENNINDYLRIICSSSNSINIDKSDNEHSSFYSLLISKCSGTWISRGVDNQFIISKNNVYFSITGTQNIEELIEIYKNIEIL